MVLLRFAILGQVSLLSAALEHTLGVDSVPSDGAVSLLQYQARLNKHQVVEEENETWAGGYMRCTEQQEYTRSDCRVVTGGLNFGGVDGGLSHPRLCAQEAQARNVDSFEFFAHGGSTWCYLKQCDSVDMKWQSSDTNWLVFSQRCGLERNTAKIDGTCREAVAGNLIYPNPPYSICGKTLKFKNVINNNLRGFGPNTEEDGHMRILETLPGVDLIIRANEDYTPWNSAKNGIHLGKFGRINLKSGTKAVFNFQFVSTGTMNHVKVPEFAMTIFDIDQFKGCYGRMSINASHFSSYHVAADTELVTKNDGGAPGRPATATFMSSMAGTKNDNPKKPREMTGAQQRKAVTLVFKNRKFFELSVEISDAGAGKNLLFGGKSSLLDGTCGRKRR
jgi:hypothetical protein